MKSRMIRLIAFASVFIIISVLLPACSPKPSEPGGQEAYSPSELTSEPAFTPAATREPTPEPTPAPTPEPTPEPSPTPLPPETDVYLPGTVHIVKTNDSSSRINAVSDIEELSVKYVDESKVGDEKSFDFAGVHFEAVYDYSIDFYLGNFRLDEYIILNHEPPFKNDDHCSVRFLPDGTIYSFPRFVIPDIAYPSYCNGETMREFAEEYYKDQIDFSQFEYFESFSSPEAGEHGEGVYYLYWYNKKGDIMETNYLYICTRKSLNSEGGFKDNISCPFMYYAANIDVSGASRELSRESVEEKVEERLREIYGKHYTRFEMKDILVTNYKGTACVYCSIVAFFEDSSVPEGIDYEYTRMLVMLDGDPAF